MGEKRTAYRLLVGKPEGKSPLETLRHRWVDKIMIDFGDSGWGGVDWVGLAQDRGKWRGLVKAVMTISEIHLTFKRRPNKEVLRVSWENYDTTLKEWNSAYAPFFSTSH
jgi:hypothetical protein